MDEEPLKYIGYSMAKKKWFIVKPANKRLDTYEFLNSGATSLVYYNKASNRVVKIIRGSEYSSNDSLIKKSQKEVAYQSRAADFGLAPKVFHHGFIETNDSFLYPDVKIPYYYILMESLSEDNGWEQEYATQNPQLFCKFINDLVDKVGIINTEDPHAHFFYNKRQDKLLMIDYDRCVDCSDKKQCKIDMANALGITCLSGGIKKRKTTKRNTTKRKTTKRNTTKRNTTKRKTTKRKTNKKRTYKRKI
jgi:hypothetical protein